MPLRQHNANVNELLIEAMQLLAEARAEKSTPEPIEKQLSGALQLLGTAFAITRSTTSTQNLGAPPPQQRLDEIFLRNEQFFSMATGNPDLDLICLGNEPIPYVRANPGQLEFLLTSSLMACREMGGGTRPVTVTIDRLTIEENVASSVDDLVAGDYAAIAVQCRTRVTDKLPQPTPYDEVLGSVEEAENICCGLGVVQQIAASMNGALVCDSSDLGCPILVVYLPTCSIADDENRKLEETPLQTQHDETVLLVDDDPMVRRYTKRALEMAGFHVLEACDSREALQTIRAESGHVDILIADLVLPDMHGGKLARAIQSEFGAVPVIFVSGYDNRAIQHHGLIEQGASLLRKPYTRRSLLTMVEAALELGA